MSSATARGDSPGQRHGRRSPGSPRTRGSPQAGGSGLAPEREVAQLRKRLRQNKQQLARLRERLAALEEEVGETRRVGLQVAHLGDLVTALLARRNSGGDGEFLEDLSSYADDI